MKKIIITIIFALSTLFSFSQKVPDTVYYASFRQLIVPTVGEQYYEDSTYELALYQQRDVRYLKVHKGRKTELYTIDQLIEEDSAFLIDNGVKGRLKIFSATRVSPELDNTFQIAIFKADGLIQAIGIADPFTIKVYSVEMKLQQNKL